MKKRRMIMKVRKSIVYSLLFTLCCNSVFDAYVAAGQDIAVEAVKAKKGKGKAKGKTKVRVKKAKTKKTTKTKPVKLAKKKAPVKKAIPKIAAPKISLDVAPKVGLPSPTIDLAASAPTEKAARATFSCKTSDANCQNLFTKAVAGAGAGALVLAAVALIVKALWGKYYYKDDKPLTLTQADVDTLADTLGGGVQGEGDGEAFGGVIQVNETYKNELLRTLERQQSSPRFAWLTYSHIKLYESAESLAGIWNREQGEGSRITKGDVYELLISQMPDEDVLAWMKAGKDVGKIKIRLQEAIDSNLKKELISKGVPEEEVEVFLELHPEVQAYAYKGIYQDKTKGGYDQLSGPVGNYQTWKQKTPDAKIDSLIEKGDITIAQAQDILAKTGSWEIRNVHEFLTKWGDKKLTADVLAQNPGLEVVLRSLADGSARTAKGAMQKYIDFAKAKDEAEPKLADMNAYFKDVLGSTDYPLARDFYAAILTAYHEGKYAADVGPVNTFYDSLGGKKTNELSAGQLQTLQMQFEGLVTNDIAVVNQLTDKAIGTFVTEYDQAGIAGLEIPTWPEVDTYMRGKGYNAEELTFISVYDYLQIPEVKAKITGGLAPALEAAVKASDMGGIPPIDVAKQQYLEGVIAVNAALGEGGVLGADGNPIARDRLAELFYQQSLNVNRFDQLLAEDPSQLTKERIALEYKDMLQEQIGDYLASYAVQGKVLPWSDIQTFMEQARAYKASEVNLTAVEYLQVARHQSLMPSIVFDTFRENEGSWRTGGTPLVPSDPHVGRAIKLNEAIQVWAAARKPPLIPEHVADILGQDYLAQQMADSTMDAKNAAAVQKDVEVKYTHAQDGFEGALKAVVGEDGVANALEVYNNYVTDIVQFDWSWTEEKYLEFLKADSNAVELIRQGGDANLDRVEFLSELWIRSGANKSMYDIITKLEKYNDLDEDAFKKLLDKKPKQRAGEPVPKSLEQLIAKDPATASKIFEEYKKSDFFRNVMYFYDVLTDTDDWKWTPEKALAFLNSGVSVVDKLLLLKTGMSPRSAITSKAYLWALVDGDSKHYREMIEALGAKDVTPADLKEFVHRHPAIVDDINDPSLVAEHLQLWKKLGRPANDALGVPLEFVFALNDYLADKGWSVEDFAGYIKDVDPTFFSKVHEVVHETDVRVLNHIFEASAELWKLTREFPKEGVLVLEKDELWKLIEQTYDPVSIRGEIYKSDYLDFYHTRADLREGSIRVKLQPMFRDDVKTTLRAADVGLDDTQAFIFTTKRVQDARGFGDQYGSLLSTGAFYKDPSDLKTKAQGFLKDFEESPEKYVDEVITYMFSQERAKTLNDLFERLDDYGMVVVEPTLTAEALERFKQGVGDTKLSATTPQEQAAFKLLIAGKANSAQEGLKNWLSTEYIDELPSLDNVQWFVKGLGYDVSDAQAFTRMSLTAYTDALRALDRWTLDPDLTHVYVELLAGGHVEFDQEAFETLAQGKEPQLVFESDLNWAMPYLLSKEKVASAKDLDMERLVKDLKGLGFDEEDLANFSIEDLMASSLLPEGFWRDIPNGLRKGFEELYGDISITDADVGKVFDWMTSQPERVQFLLYADPDAAAAALLREKTKKGGEWADLVGEQLRNEISSALSKLYRDDIDKDQANNIAAAATAAQKRADGARTILELWTNMKRREITTFDFDPDSLADKFEEAARVAGMEVDAGFKAAAAQMQRDVQALMSGEQAGRVKEGFARSLKDGWDALMDVSRDLAGRMPAEKAYMSEQAARAAEGAYLAEHLVPEEERGE